MQLKTRIAIQQLLSLAKHTQDMETQQKLQKFLMDRMDELEDQDDLEEFLEGIITEVSEYLGYLTDALDFWGKLYNRLQKLADEKNTNGA